MKYIFGITDVYPIQSSEIYDEPETFLQKVHRKVEPIIEGILFSSLITLISIPFWLAIIYLK